MGAAVRLNDDTAWDEENNSGTPDAVSSDVFNPDGNLTKSLKPEQTYTQRAGCTVNPGSGTWLVKGRDTTHGVDADGDGQDTGENAVLLACEELANGGKVYVSGGLFLADDAMKEPDNIRKRVSGNQGIAEAVLGIEPLVTIDEMRSGGDGEVFRIRGWATSGTSHPGNIFPNTIYLQDDTGGVALVPFTGGEVQVGTPIEAVGQKEIRDGNVVLKIIEYEVLGKPLYNYTPETTPNKTAMDYEANGGRLMQVEGRVTDVTYSVGGKGVSRITLKDGNGDLAEILIEEDIVSGADGKNDLASQVKEGRTVRAIGILNLNVYVLLIQLIRLAEQDEADGKDNDQRAHGHVFVLQLQPEDMERLPVGELADHGDQGRTQEGRTLAADVHEAKVFAAALRRDDLPQIAAAQRLNAALEHAHQNRQHPELPLGHQKHGEQGNAGVAENADFNEQPRIVPGGEPAEGDGAGKGHKLGQQQCQQQPGGVQPQGGAVGRGHVDDGVNAVDEEEKGQQIQENMLLLPNLPEGAPQLSEGGENGAAGMLHEGGLTVTLQQRLGAYEPPPGGNEEGYDHGRSRADADLVPEQHQKQAKNEGNHGADVAVGVAHGGYRVHPLVGGDLREHGVVEHQAGGIPHLGQNEHDQKRQPSAHAAHGGAAENAQKHTGHENGLFEPPVVGQRAADGADDGHQQRRDGTGVAPIGQIQ